MNTAIKRAGHWIDRHPKAREWMWFAILWCGGLCAALAIAYPIKWLVKFMSS